MTIDEANLFANDIINYTHNTVEFDNTVRIKRQHESNANGEFVEVVIQIPYSEGKNENSEG